MSRINTSDLERLARGRAIAQDAFLALLADPQAQQDLATIAQVRDLLTPPSDEREADRPPEGDVNWNALVAYVEGTLIDGKRRQEVEQLLARHAPELLRQAESAATILDRGGESETQVERPRPQRPNEPGGDRG